MTLIVTPPYTEPVVPDKSNVTALRLVALGGLSTSVGIFEFEVFDKNRINLCRDPEYVPTVTASAAAKLGPISTETYKPSNTIDGDYYSWPATCYIPPQANGSSYLEYQFKKPITLVAWRMVCEGNYIAATNGMKLQAQVDGVWGDVECVTQDPVWRFATWKEFTVV